MKILIADTYYPDFLQSLPFNPAAMYESELSEVLHQSFGTADFYSRNLNALGWIARDVIVNHGQLQELYAQEHSGWHGGDRLEGQIHDFQPDVVFLQDLSLKVPETGALIAGQCSCPWPEAVPRLDCVFTSFPFYVNRFESMGIKCVYNPLAFDPIVLDRVGPLSTERIHDVVFIGGVGNPSHWRNGMFMLESVARAIPTFKWWGYGFNSLPHDSPLRKCYQGEAWGLDMYRILLQSKICLNRHGEVAEGYTNNMRCFEATGCGALLLTERSPNLHHFFGATEVAPYGSPDEAVYAIERFLENDPARAAVARAGQRRTLLEHNYVKRMRTVSETLTTLLVEREVSQ